MVVLVAAAAIISLGALYLYSLSIGPTALPIGDLRDELVGRLVETVGVVDEVHLSSSGIRLLLMDPLDYAEIVAFARRDVYEAFQEREALVPGAEVWVRGELQLYRGELEILISSAADITITREA